MPKILIIVESPNKIKKISEILGDGYEVIASFGSIRDLPPNSMGVDIDNNFNPTFCLMKDKTNILQNILDRARVASKVILASDNDLEGEAISAHIQHYIKPINKNIKRAVFNEITKSGIKKGLDNLRDIDKNLFSSQVCRRIADRLIGFSASPYLINKYKTNLSAGRTQSSCVKLITDLDQKIEEFKSEEYWNISASFKLEANKSFIAKYENKIKNKTICDQIINQIITEKNYLINSVKAQKKVEKPQPPLITVKLQQICAKLYGFSADKTMKHAQFLFENGICTYIRTDSQSASPEAISAAREFIKNAGFKPPKSANYYGAKDAAHECIRPTNIETTPDTGFISGDDKLVYKVIWEYFIASQMEPAVFNSLKIKLSGIKDKNLIFGLSGKALEIPGYLAIFGNIEPSKLEIPFMKEGQEVIIDPNSIKPEQKYTQPPSRFNDATILEILERKGIGRPSTYANLISTITNRNYVEKQGNTFHSTKLGREITKALEYSFSFVNSDYTSKMELKLDQIAEGKLNALDMLNEFYSGFKKELNAAYIKDGHDICSCGGIMIKRKSKNGDEFFGCNSFPRCRLTKNIVNESNRNEKE